MRRLACSSLLYDFNYISSLLPRSNQAHAPLRLGPKLQVLHKGEVGLSFLMWGRPEIVVISLTYGEAREAITPISGSSSHPVWAHSVAPSL